MKEYDKRKSHISSKLHTIYISSNNIRRPVTKTVRKTLQDFILKRKLSDAIFK